LFNAVGSLAELFLRLVLALFAWRLLLSLFVRRILSGYELFGEGEGEDLRAFLLIPVRPVKSRRTLFGIKFLTSISIFYFTPRILLLILYKFSRRWIRNTW
jgi:hypothetical protein